MPDPVPPSLPPSRTAAGRLPRIGAAEHSHSHSPARGARRSSGAHFERAGDGERVGEERVKQLLLGVQFFRSALASELGALLQHVDQIVVERYAQLLREGTLGHVAHFFFVIVSGEVEVWNARGFSIHLGAGRCFGESALSENPYPRSHSVTVTRRALLLRLNSLELCASATLRRLLKRERPKIERRIIGNLLFSLPFFGGLAPEVVDEICHLFTCRDEIGGVALCTEGDADSREMFFVANGAVGVFKHGARVSTIRHTDSTPWVGERALLVHKPRAASLVTVEPTRLLALHADQLPELLRAVPTIHGIFRTQDRFYAVSSVDMLGERAAPPDIEAQATSFSRRRGQVLVAAALGDRADAAGGAAAAKGGGARRPSEARTEGRPRRAAAQRATHAPARATHPVGRRRPGQPRSTAADRLLDELELLEPEPQPLPADAEQAAAMLAPVVSSTLLASARSWRPGGEGTPIEGGGAQPSGLRAPRSALFELATTDAFDPAEAIRQGPDAHEGWHVALESNFFARREAFRVDQEARVTREATERSLWLHSTRPSRHAAGDGGTRPHVGASPVAAAASKQATLPPLPPLAAAASLSPSVGQPGGARHGRRFRQAG